MATGCRATNQAGSPCSASVYRDGWCRWHHPDLGEERRRWSAKGGANRSNKARAKKRLPADPMTEDELLAWLGVAFKAVLTGKMQPNIGNSAATIAKAIVSVRQSSELEARLAALEERAGVRSA